MKHRKPTGSIVRQLIRNQLAYVHRTTAHTPEYQLWLRRRAAERRGQAQRTPSPRRRRKAQRARWKQIERNHERLFAKLWESWGRMALRDTGTNAPGRTPFLWA